MYISVLVDIDDVVSDLSSSEKRELCQELIEDGHGPDLDEGNNLEEILSQDSETHSERELGKLIGNIWSNKHFIDIQLIEELSTILRNKNII